MGIIIEMDNEWNQYVNVLSQAPIKLRDNIDCITWETKNDGEVYKVKRGTMLQQKFQKTNGNGILFMYGNYKYC